jgi:hypothetical protein
MATPIPPSPPAAAQVPNPNLRPLR